MMRNLSIILVFCFLQACVSNVEKDIYGSYQLEKSSGIDAKIDIRNNREFEICYNECILGQYVFTEIESSRARISFKGRESVRIIFDIKEKFLDHKKYPSDNIQRKRLSESLQKHIEWGNYTTDIFFESTETYIYINIEPDLIFKLQ